MAYTKTNWVNGTTPLNDKNMNKIENALENLDTNISKSTDEYSSTRTYSIGELVIYNNKLYKANQDITTAEAFNSSHWTEVTLLSDVNEIKSVVNNNADNLNKMDEGIANIDTEINSLKQIVVASNAGAHNAIYRGKDITDLFYNGTLSRQIAEGTFDDIFVGDYIIGKTSKRKYLVADLDYRFRMGDTEITKHHVLMIPEKTMGTAKMNDSNITTGGYKGSKMYTDYLTPFKTVINNDFGAGHILSHKNLLTNAVSNNASSGWEWLTSTIELMNECMVYGHNAWGSHHGYETGIDKRQLSLFKLDQSKIVARKDNNERYWYWLRDVVSSSDFAYVSSGGNANYSTASNANGVRPAFLIY